MTTLDSSKEIQKNNSEISDKHEDFRMFGLITFLINVFLSLRNGKDSGDNPWNALTPEWLTSSPPPVENWEGEAPLVEEPYGYGKQFSEQK